MPGIAADPCAFLGPAIPVIRADHMAGHKAVERKWSGWTVAQSQLQRPHGGRMRPVVTEENPLVGLGHRRAKHRQLRDGHGDRFFDVDIFARQQRLRGIVAVRGMGRGDIDQMHRKRQGDPVG